MNENPPSPASQDQYRNFKMTMRIYAWKRPVAILYFFFFFFGEAHSWDPGGKKRGAQMSPGAWAWFTSSRVHCCYTLVVSMLIWTPRLLRVSSNLWYLPRGIISLLFHSNNPGPILLFLYFFHLFIHFFLFFFSTDYSKLSVKYLHDGDDDICRHLGKGKMMKIFFFGYQ